jgi:hypothetical protein
MFLICSFFLVVGLSFTLYHTDKTHSFNKREIASEFNCIEATKSFFTEKAAMVGPHIKSALDKFRGMSLEARLFSLEIMGKLNINSNFLRAQYASLLNKSFSEGLISSHDLEELVTKINAGKDWIKIGKNHKAFVDILDDFASVEEARSLIDMLLNDKKKSEEFKSIVEKLDLTQLELNSLKEIKGPLDANQLNKIFSYISFTRTLKETDRKSALVFMEDIANDNFPDSSFVATYQKYQKKISDYIEKEKNKSIATLKKSGSSNALTDGDLIEKATSMALEKGKIFEKLTFSCKSKNANASRLGANKRFINTMLGLNLAISSGSYIYTHRDQEHDLLWYKKLSFDIFVPLVNVMIGSKISIKPGDKNFLKMIKVYATSTATSIPSALSYSKLFGAKDKEKEALYNEMLQSPEFKAQLNELANYIDNEEEKVRLQELMVHLEDSKQSYKDISEGEAKDLLSEALAKELYEKKQGDWIQTGDVGLDRYVFMQLWGTQSAVRNVVVNLLMYDALCMGELNPVKAYTLALTYFIINKTVFNTLQNVLRKKAINQ